MTVSGESKIIHTGYRMYCIPTRQHVRSMKMITLKNYFPIAQTFSNQIFTREQLPDNNGQRPTSKHINKNRKPSMLVGDWQPYLEFLWYRQPSRHISLPLRSFYSSVLVFLCKLFPAIFPTRYLANWLTFGYFTLANIQVEYLLFKPKFLQHFLDQDCITCI